MILKSMARKSRTFGQLLRYIDSAPALGVPLAHNLQAQAADLEAVRREFFANSKLLPHRRNGNYLYHEILSFASTDRPLVTPAIIETVTRQYLEWRAPYQLGYARAHFDTDCPHVHIVLSANSVGGTQRQRLSRAEFQQVKDRLAAFVQERFPQLEAWGLELRAKSNQIREGRPESERRRRGAKTLSRKEQLRQIVAGTLLMAPSGQACQELLGRRGLRLYQRGKTVSLLDEQSGRRHRLKTLGLLAAFEQAREGWSSLEMEPQARERHRPERSRQPLVLGLSR